jgi:hypothetical protein
MKKLYFLFFLTIGFLANSQIINFTDVNFKAKLLEASSSNQIARDINGAYFKIDTNNNNEIEYTEAEDVYELNISNLSSIQSVKISDITGLSHFSNLRKFYCIDNLLTNLDLTSFTNLLAINCGFNQLTSLNISGLNQLEFLSCESNQIINLDLSNKPSLATLYCEANNISNLNFNGLTNLIYLTLSGNPISILDFSGINNIEQLQCMYTNITSLNVSNQTNLDLLMCGHNPSLERIFMKNGKMESGLNLINLPNLKYVCVDEAQLTTIQNTINFSSGSSNCSVNTYCTFTPGGTFYEISGNTKYDLNNNGCDVSYIDYSNLHLSITDGTNTGSLIANQTGDYYIPVSDGNHIITPNLENPTYFNISPTSFVADFPTQASPFIQDFCVTANGIKHDVEVVLIPTVPARPGFDASYILLFRNKGNQIESGSISLTFDDTRLDYVSATPVYNSTATNSFSWDYSNLQPFETGEIEITFNVNSPMETPAVNNGDVLNYIATITTTNTDETPADNTFTLDQTVVGSYDPNDKTCLQGETIEPSMVGEYVHYLIRFENTGTYFAENIVVKDMIDTSKFDIATLVPLNSSHDFFTRISGNKVEFIFENINLDFDDATNDGYVLFKIKTLPTLTIGDTFSNQVNIYFDYNFPIVTNNYTTTVQLLNNQSFEFSSYFTIYPNPVKDILNIQSEQGLIVNSMEIYNQLGQIVIAVTNTSNRVDISNLASGIYFVKVNTDKGTANTKFIKE